MTARLIATILPYAIVAMLLLALVLFVLALQQLRRGRTGPYWRLRRQAGQRGGQLFLISITLFGLAFALAFFSGLADLALNGLNAALSRDPDGLRGVVIPTLTEPSTQAATATADVRATTQAARSVASTLTALRPSDTPPPSETTAPTETPPPTLTPTDTPTITPTATPTFERVLQLTPAASSQQPPRGASIELVAAASGVTPDQAPVEAGTAFEAGIERIYFFVRFDSMENGVAWTRILYRERVPIQGQSYRWSLGESGESYFFFGDADGYPPGSYEVRIFIGAEEASRLSFTVVGL